MVNVHGVRQRFLEIGEFNAGGGGSPRRLTRGAYFIGKARWGKGYRQLIDQVFSTSCLTSAV